MTGWRAHAANGDWLEIKPIPSSTNERSELREMLEKIVPTRTRGDGLEQFESWIEPHEADDRQTAKAAFLLHALRDIETQERPEVEKLFLAAVNLAKRTLSEELAIKYTGLEDTYHYQRPDGTFKQVRKSYGRLICAYKLAIKDEPFVIEKLFDRPMTFSRNLHTWMARYPWRRTMEIFGFWAVGNFVPNSNVDHAVSILVAEREYLIKLRFAEQPPSGSAFQKADDYRLLIDPWDIAKLAFEIGRHFDALQKKPNEHHAIKRIQQVNKNRENGKLGGHSRKKIESYAVLNKLANAHPYLSIESDRSARRLAKELARKYDAGTDLQLFSIRGKLFEDRWFSDWLDIYRESKRKQMLEPVVRDKNGIQPALPARDL